MTGGLKMGVNVAAHTRHIFLGSASPPPRSLHVHFCYMITMLWSKENVIIFSAFKNRFKLHILHACENNVLQTDRPKNKKCV